MSHFSACLSSVVASTGVSLREVARTAGIHSSPLSRVCSGEIPPSRAFLRAVLACLNPAHFQLLEQDHAPELLLAYLRDCAVDAGADLASLRLSISEDPHAEWWSALQPALAAQLRGLGLAAMQDEDFATILSDLEPLALKLLGALHDARELGRLREAQIHPFPTHDESTVVVENPPTPPSPAKGRRARSAPALPVGGSQEPTA
jgi:transcriptional regulator with XRE-family HTH domain